MRFVLPLLAVLCVFACSNDEDIRQPPPGVITLGVLPDQSVDGLTARFSPLVAYLERAAGVDIALKIPTSYETMLDDFEAGNLDLASFGGVTFVQAEQRCATEPLVMRDVDLQFVSCYLVRSSDARRSISEFEGESFAFGPELSTSGHLMPRYFLTAAGMTPEQFFSSVRHSPGHDETVDLVRDGAVTVGVANCDILRSMMEDGRASEEDVRVLETTPPYANYVWGVRGSLDAALKTRLRDAFLALDVTNPEHAALLRAQGANGYLPAGREDLDDVREAARQVGLVSETKPE